MKSWHVTAQEHVTGAVRFRSADAESAAMFGARVDVQYMLGLFKRSGNGDSSSAHARLYGRLVALALT